MSTTILRAMHPSGPLRPYMLKKEHFVPQALLGTSPVGCYDSLGCLEHLEQQLPPYSCSMESTETLLLIASKNDLQSIFQ